MEIVLRFAVSEVDQEQARPSRNVAQGTSSRKLNATVFPAVYLGQADLTYLVSVAAKRTLLICGDLMEREDCGKIHFH